jgi:hypothetical protein
MIIKKEVFAKMVEQLPPTWQVNKVEFVSPAKLVCFYVSCPVYPDGFVYTFNEVGTCLSSPDTFNFHKNMGHYLYGAPYIY